MLAALAAQAALIAAPRLREPTVVGVSSGAVIAPARRHLRKHRGEYAGARAILLRFTLGVAVSVDEPIAPIRLATSRIASWAGTTVERVAADHEVYLPEL